jgi:hypothetical protein
LLERRAFVDSLLKAGATVDQICTLAAKAPELDQQGKRTGGGFGLTHHQVKTLVRDLRALLAEELQTPTAKLEQLGRLRNDLLKMRSMVKPPHAAISSHEKLIAEIEGNLAPRRIQHEVHAIPDAVAAICGSMTNEEVESLMLEEREREKMLRAIPTTGEAVASPHP